MHSQQLFELGFAHTFKQKVLHRSTRSDFAHISCTKHAGNTVFSRGSPVSTHERRYNTFIRRAARVNHRQRALMEQYFFILSLQTLEKMGKP